MAKKNEPVEQITEEKKSKDKEYIFAVGRRKEAVARIRYFPKITEGSIVVNGKPIEQYFADKGSQAVYSQFLSLVDGKKLTATVRVVGGGNSGQLDAMLHGLARALSDFDTEKYRLKLKQKGYLTRDARERQRRNVGMGGKSRRKKQSPKR